MFPDPGAMRNSIDRNFGNSGFLGISTDIIMTLKMGDQNQ